MLMLAGLFVWSGGRLIALEYEDFSKGALEKLIAVGAPAAELTFSGPPQVEAQLAVDSFGYEALAWYLLIKCEDRQP